MSRKTRELSDRKGNLSRAEFQFSVSSIFVLTFVVAVSIVFLRALSVRFGPAAAAIFILAVLSIFAHVAGAIIGGRLRAKKDILEVDLESKSGETSNAAQNAARRTKHVQPLEARSTDFAPPTELSHQKPLERRSLYYAACIGGGFSATLASIVLTWFMWNELRIINVLFGSASAAVIGALFGCLLSSLYQVARSAWSEAQKDTRF